MQTIQGNLDDMTMRIEVNLPWNVQDIAYQTPNTELLKSGSRFRQMVTGPEGQVMRQVSQQDEHFLSGKRGFVAFGQTQALLVVTVLGFDATPAPIIGIHDRPERGRGRDQLPQGVRGERRDQDRFAPLAVGSARANGNLL